MLLRYKADARIAALSWRVLEVHSPENAEVIARRVVRIIPRIFGKHGVEVFLCSAFVEQGWVFIRSLRNDLLQRLASVHGISVNKEAVLEQSYIAGLLDQARAEHERRTDAIRPGSFVRILDGFTRDYCGTIESLKAGIATVAVQGCAMKFTVKTPLSNLEDLSHVPTAQRVFYSAAQGGVARATSNPTEKRDPAQESKVEARAARSRPVHKLRAGQGRDGRRGPRQCQRVQHLLRQKRNPGPQQSHYVAVA